MRNRVGFDFSKLCNYQGCGRGIYTFVNPYSYLMLRRNMSLVDGFDGVMIDGGLARRVFSIFLRREYARQSFDYTSLAPKIFNYCVLNGLTVAFVGAKKEEIFGAMDAICKEHPGINVVSFRDGYFVDDEMARHVEFLRELNPDVVIVGMGTPLQEKFLLSLRISGWDGLGFTCGGFLHQTAAAGGKYYPEFVNRLGLRWAFRIYDEPSLLRRYIKYYPIFFVFFVIDFFQDRRV